MSSSSSPSERGAEGCEVARREPPQVGLDLSRVDCHGSTQHQEPAGGVSTGVLTWGWGVPRIGVQQCGEVLPDG